MFNKREYAKKYYLDNKERLLKKMNKWKEDNPKYMEKWRENNREEIKEYRIQYYKNHKEKVKRNRKQYYQNNKELINQWYKNNEGREEYLKQYNLKNKKKISEHNKKYQKIWLKTEKGKASHQRDGVNRRTKLKEILNTLTSQEWLDILKEYKYKCAYCGCKFNKNNPPTKDHVIPISKGGDNTKENIVPACRICNAKKGTKINSGGKMECVLQ